MTDEAERAAAEAAAINRTPGDQRLEQPPAQAPAPAGESSRFTVFNLPLDQFSLVATPAGELTSEGDPIAAAENFIADFDPGLTFHTGGSFSFIELRYVLHGASTAKRYAAFWNAEAGKWDHAGDMTLQPDARRFFDHLCDLANKTPAVLKFGQQFTQTPRVH